MTFGEKLKRLRNDNGMTQEQLAEKNFCYKNSDLEMGNEQRLSEY